MSKIEVNAVEPQSGTTLTLGASGDTVALAAGASQTGFGRSGSVNWDTTAKTTGFTAVSGNGYFCNTTSGAFTVTLPLSPSAGAIVAIADYNGTAGTNPITVGRNSSNINGAATNFTISINYAAISFVYVDATAGWRSVDTSDVTSVSNQFVSATGGTITTCGNYKIHSFTGPGTFTVTNTGSGSSTVDYLVVAGGGGGGNANGGGGGGGAGGYRESIATGSPWTASPLASSTSLPVSVTGYPITVGGGGSGGYFVTPSNPTAGNPSVFSTITSAGGGIGAQGAPSVGPQNGGSGGGGSYATAGGTGNTPPVSPSQGNNGGNGNGSPPVYGGGGGGGASAAGTSGTSTTEGNGGAGTTSSISGTPIGRAGGGGGGGIVSAPGGSASDGGGAGGGGTGGTVGTINTGGGGGGAGGSGGGGAAGGSGIVVIRYKFQ